MFRSLDRVDWELLHQQKLALLEVLDGLDRKSSMAEALWGIVHLLDALQDDAVAAGRWAFPDEAVNSAGSGTSASERYYVQDDEGHHHGPMDDCDEADAIHGRAIVQEVERPSASPEKDGEAGSP